MIVSKRDPHGVVPFEVRGLPGVFPCPLDQWLADTGLAEKDLEAYNDVLEIESAPAGAHTANAETAADISAAVTRKKAS